MKTPDEWFTYDESFRYIDIYDSYKWDRTVDGWDKEWDKPLTSQQLMQRLHKAMVVRYTHKERIQERIRPYVQGIISFGLLMFYLGLIYYGWLSVRYGGWIIIFIIPIFLLFGGKYIVWDLAGEIIEGIEGKQNYFPDEWIDYGR